jgi:hypothetical protein
MNYTVYIRQHWEERFSIDVEADSIEEAKTQALDLAGDELFSWENTEMTRRVAWAIDDDKEEVYSIDNDDTAQPEESELLDFIRQVAAGNTEIADMEKKAEALLARVQS